MIFAASVMADWGCSALSFLDSLVALISLGGNPGKTAIIVLIRRGKSIITRNTILVVNWKSRKKILMLTQLILAGFFPVRVCIANIVLQDTAKDLLSIKAILVNSNMVYRCPSSPKNQSKNQIYLFND